MIWTMLVSFINNLRYIFGSSPRICLARSWSWAPIAATPPCGRRDEDDPVGGGEDEQTWAEQTSAVVISAKMTHSVNV